MSIDVCFWWRGKPSLSPEELYEEAADGIADNFEPSSLVIEFRERLSTQWPGIEQSFEPLAYDPDLDEQEDLSRFILITLPYGRADVMPEITEMARTFGLTGYDPQSEQRIGQA
jgi:hypothetical protein